MGCSNEWLLNMSAYHRAPFTPLNQIRQHCMYFRIHLLKCWVTLQSRYLKNLHQTYLSHMIIDCKDISKSIHTRCRHRRTFIKTLISSPILFKYGIHIAVFHYPFRKQMLNKKCWNRDVSKNQDELLLIYKIRKGVELGKRSAVESHILI